MKQKLKNLLVLGGIMAVFDTSFLLSDRNMVFFNVLSYIISMIFFPILKKKASLSFFYKRQRGLSVLKRNLS